MQTGKHAGRQAWKQLQQASMHSGRQANLPDKYAAGKYGCMHAKI